MVLENVCAPALLYLAFSIIQIIIDMYRGETIQAFFKFIVMIIFTIVLNAICSSGMTIISWFIVFIPFILMTYITTILFFIFGQRRQNPAFLLFFLGCKWTYHSRMNKTKLVSVFPRSCSQFIQYDDNFK